MSINPLFTGPMPKERSPMYNSGTLSTHRASSVLRQTNLNSGNMSCNSSPGPRKKPRMGDSVGSEPNNDADPFDDFDSFTEDDLETLDLIASQALSQAPDDRASVQTLKRPAGVLSHSAPLANTNTTTNIMKTSTGYTPVQHTSNVSSSGRFSFKSTISRGGHSQTTTSGLPNRLSTTTSANPQSKSNPRQSNVAGNKIYVSPHYHSGAFFHGGSHQQDYNSDSTKAQTLRPGRPTVFPQKPIQSNIANKVTVPKATSKLESTLGVVGMADKNTTRNDPHNLYIDTSHHTTSVPYNTKPTLNQHSCNTGRTFHLPTSQGGGCSTTTLTPPNPAIARESPNLPMAGTDLKPPSLPTGQQQQFPKYRSECEALKQQLKSLTEEKLVKDGEIEVLRQNLNKAKAETSRLQLERMQAEELRKQQIGELEKEQKKEIESLKTQLQFKEAELMQAQSETQTHRARMLVPSTSNSAPTTPPKHLSCLSASRSDEATRNSESDFPTQQSFMANNPKVDRTRLRSPRVRTVSEGQAARSSPKRSPKCSMSSKSPGKASPARPVSAPLASLSSSVQYGKPPGNKKRFCMLSGRHPRASSSEAQLVGSLLQDQDSQDNTSTSVGGLISLIQGTRLHGFSSLTEEMSLSKPSPAKRTGIFPRSTLTCDQASKTTSPSVTLVTKAISNILNPPRIPLLPPYVSPLTKSTPGPRPSQSHLGHLPNSESVDSETHITDLLPLLEDQLTSYISTIQSILNSVPSLCSSSCPSSGNSGIRTTDCSSESTSSSCFTDDAITLGHAEAAVFTSMNMLRRMVAYSAAARLSVLNGSSSKDLEPIETDGDVSAMEIDPSAPLIDPTQAPSKSSAHTSDPQEALLKPTDITSLDQHNNHILSKLMRIASMQHTLGNSSFVVESALYLLCVLTQKSCCEEIERLQSLLVHDALYNAMSQESTYSQACRAIDTLTSVSPSWKLVSKFCNQSDSCLLFKCYQCGVHGLPGRSFAQKRQLTIKVMSMLWRIVATHHQGATMLLDTECQCSIELINAVVSMFRMVLRVTTSVMTHQHPTKYWRNVLQQGLLLLHCLAMHDRTFTDQRLDVEKSYVATVTSLSKLYHRIPDATDNETGLVQDLWDLTQCDETDWEPDEDEDEDDDQLGVAQMVVN